MSLQTMLTIYFALVVLILLFFARNSATMHIRNRFIKENHSHYHALPEYDAMLWKPRYWHMWTYGQWYRYLEDE